MEEKTDKQLLEERQAAVNKKNAEFVETLSDSDKKKVEAISVACQTLEGAEIPFWLFAERPVEIGEGVITDKYLQYNWVPKIYEGDGKIGDTGGEFLYNHMRELCQNVYMLISAYVAGYTGGDEKLMEYPPAEQVKSYFAWFAAEGMKRDRELID